MADFVAARQAVYTSVGTATDRVLLADPKVRFLFINNPNAGRLWVTIGVSASNTALVEQAGNLRPFRLPSNPIAFSVPADGEPLIAVPFGSRLIDLASLPTNPMIRPATAGLVIAVTPETANSTTIIEGWQNHPERVQP
jgi:hypothetical protein